MAHVEEKLHEINCYLLRNSKDENELGLFNGKLGLTIYLYNLAHKSESQNIQEMADNLIGEIYEKIGSSKLSTDFSSGLAGIAWGISHLVNSDFVDADLDDTLSELDDKIFKFLNVQKGDFSVNIQSGLIGYLFYCLDRLENSLKSKHSSNIYIFHMLGASLLNQLGQLIEEEKYQDKEPQSFSLFWDLPLVLIVLTKAKKLKVNANKVDRIVDFLLPSLLSLLPRLHSNRVYLLLGIESILVEIHNSSLRNHADLLKNSINLKSIIYKEYNNLNICLVDGICGLKLIGNRLSEITGENSFVPTGEQVLQKINLAACWEDNDFYSHFKKSIGLFSGLSGIGWILLEDLNVVEKLGLLND
ncbi:hypothetical protein JYB64_20575 [Algoriphagus aestuarii]|nr:hypothetical protein [Algoriphagus aestuarii]